ncbi:MAG: tetratricopeptide repeat protein [Bacteroidales bacterium]|nr:tetratricopeptide repeat protein [Bacteroidales bacterium]
MKCRHLVLLILFQLPLWVVAQTQQGYVKTLGRPEKKGEALGGVTVRVKGEHNPVVSNQDGTFSLLLADKKNGDAYSLQQVQKNGYELNENDMIGRKLAFSDKVPLTIVMVSSEQLQADKQRIENNAYKTAEKNYKAKYNLLEKQLSDNKITAEQYREEILDLQDKFEKYQSLIDGLAEHYAHTDYDKLDEKDREINLCIENGDLEHADSLIRLLFDPIGVLERNMEAFASIERQIAQAHEIIDQANKDMAAVLKQQEKDAEYLYQLYTIALARYDNDKAQSYIETRAALDKTNVEWQLDASDFFRTISDYPMAEHYLDIAWDHVFSSENDLNPMEAKYYDCKGDLLKAKGECIETLMAYNKALSIKNNIYGTNNLEITSTKMKRAWGYMGYYFEYSQALNEYEEALGIIEANLGKNHPNTAFCNRMIGFSLLLLNYNETALEYLQEALTVLESYYGEVHHEIATCYKYIGMAYASKQDYTKANEYYHRALRIRKTIYGNNSPKVADIYDYIAYAFSHQNNIDSCRWYQEKSITIWDEIYSRSISDYYESVFTFQNYVYCSDDDLHRLPNRQFCPVIMIDDYSQAMLADHACELGEMYIKREDYARAIEFFQEAYYVYRFFHVPNIDLEDLLSKIERLQEEMNTRGVYTIDFGDSVDKSSKKKRLNEEQEPIVLEYEKWPTDYWSIDTTTSLFDVLRKYRDSNYEHMLVLLEDGVLTQHYCQASSIRIRSRVIRKEEKERIKQVYHQYKNTQAQAEDYCKIGDEYLKQKDYVQAETYYQKALLLFEPLAIENSNTMATIYDNIGSVYDHQGDYGKALEYYNKALTIWQSIHGESYPSLATDYNDIGIVYFKLGDYVKALEYFDKTLAIKKNVFGENNLDVAACYNNMGFVYANQDDYGNALEYFSKALAIRKSILGENDSNVINLQQRIMDLGYKQALNNHTIQAFNEIHCYTATIVEGDTPASKQGMFGEYILLEFADWNQDSPTSLFDKNNELKGKPKDILVMKDGQITQHHFENSIGTQLGLKHVGKAEKQRISKSYDDWKKQNRH